MSIASLAQEKLNRKTRENLSWFDYYFSMVQDEAEQDLSDKIQDNHIPWFDLEINQDILKLITMLNMFGFESAGFCLQRSEDMQVALPEIPFYLIHEPCKFSWKDGREQTEIVKRTEKVSEIIPAKKIISLDYREWIQCSLHLKGKLQEELDLFSLNRDHKYGLKIITVVKNNMATGLFYLLNKRKWKIKHLELRAQLEAAQECQSYLSEFKAFGRYLQEQYI